MYDVFDRNQWNNGPVANARLETIANGSAAEPAKEAGRNLMLSTKESEARDSTQSPISYLYNSLLMLTSSTRSHSASASGLQRVARPPTSLFVLVGCSFVLSRPRTNKRRVCVPGADELTERDSIRFVEKSIMILFETKNKCSK